MQLSHQSHGLLSNTCLSLSCPETSLKLANVANVQRNEITDQYVHLKLHLLTYLINHYQHHVKVTA